MEDGVRLDEDVIRRRRADRRNVGRRGAAHHHAVAARNDEILSARSRGNVDAGAVDDGVGDLAAGIYDDIIRRRPAAGVGAAQDAAREHAAVGDVDETGGYGGAAGISAFADVQLVDLHDHVRGDGRRAVGDFGDAEVVVPEEVVQLAARRNGDVGRVAGGVDEHAPAVRDRRGVDRSGVGDVEDAAVIGGDADGGGGVVKRERAAIDGDALRGGVVVHHHRGVFLHHDAGDRGAGSRHLDPGAGGDDAVGAAQADVQIRIGGLVAAARVDVHVFDQRTAAVDVRGAVGEKLHPARITGGGDMQTVADGGVGDFTGLVCRCYARQHGDIGHGGVVLVDLQVAAGVREGDAGTCGVVVHAHLRRRIEDHVVYLGGAAAGHLNVSAGDDGASDRRSRPDVQTRSRDGVGSGVDVDVFQHCAGVGEPQARGGIQTHFGHVAAGVNADVGAGNVRVEDPPAGRNFQARTVPVDDAGVDMDVFDGGVASVHRGAGGAAADADAAGVSRVLQPQIRIVGHSRVVGVGAGDAQLETAAGNGGAVPIAGTVDYSRCADGFVIVICHGSFLLVFISRSTLVKLFFPLYIC